MAEALNNLFFYWSRPHELNYRCERDLFKMYSCLRSGLQTEIILLAGFITLRKSFFFLLHIVICGTIHMKLLVGPSLQSCWLNISLISHGQSESLFRNPRNRVACMDGIIPDSNGRFVVTIKTCGNTTSQKPRGVCHSNRPPRRKPISQSERPKAGSEKHSASEHWDS